MQKNTVQTSPLISLSQVSKNYETAAGLFPALKEVSLDIAAGSFTAIVGKSGSGKSTLMNMITGIDQPSSGQILIAGSSVHTMNQKQLSRWRGRNIGVVFQFFQLLPTLTVIENVMLPMDFCNVWAPRERRERAMTLLKRTGIADQADKLPSSLSGGQQQRAAIARALANNPPIIAADEPTGNLDNLTTEAVLGLFMELREEGKTILMVTHERDISRFSTSEVSLTDGEISSEGRTSAHIPHQDVWQVKEGLYV